MLTTQSDEKQAQEEGSLPHGAATSPDLGMIEKSDTVVTTEGRKRERPRDVATQQPHTRNHIVKSIMMSCWVDIVPSSDGTDFGIHLRARPYGSYCS